MNSTATPEPGDAEDQAYFRQLEEAFLALRGTTTLLGPEDWRTAQRWRRLGVPAELAVAVMESLFARQRERKSKRGISSLRYFRAAVEAAWDERLALQAGGARPVADPGPPIARRLESLAAAIDDRVPAAADLRAELGALSGEPGAIEASLTELDREWRGRLAATLDPAEREQLEHRVRDAIARLGGGTPEEEVKQLAESLRARALREHFGLPTLSLFAPEARGDDGDDAS